MRDIGRYLCQVVYDLEVPKASQRASHDGMIGASKVQVRINNCPIGTPVRLDDTIEFDELIVVLGPNCKLRPENIEDDFIFYRFAREEALEKFKTASGQYIGGRSAFAQGYDKVLSFT